MWSEAIDRAVQLSGRPDKLDDLQNWAVLNMTEMQAKGILKRNLIEDTVLTGNASINPYIWTRPPRFQRMLTARYPGGFEGEGVFPEFCPPGKRQKEYPNRYYAGPTYFAFCGPDLIDRIDVAYYQLRGPLPYFPVGKRPVTYDWNLFTNEFHNLTTDGIAPYNLDYTDPANQQAAIDACQNWILQDYWQLHVEGLLAKLWKAVNDETRAATHFSFYNRTLNDVFLTTELLESLAR